MAWVSAVLIRSSVRPVGRAATAYPFLSAVGPRLPSVTVVPHGLGRRCLLLCPPSEQPHLSGGHCCSAQFAYIGGAFLCPTSA